MERLPYFDTHAHLDTEDFDADREALLQEIGSHMLGFINPGCDVRSSKASLAMAHRYDYVYAAVGLHPEDLGHVSEGDLEEIYQLAQDDKVVAIGEIGLDYYWDKENHEKQEYWFRRQIALAREEKLPMIIHSREAAADTLRVMKEEKSEEIGGVIHCFSYSVEMAEEYLKMGFYLGIGGVVTFKNAKKIKEVVQMAPMERILLETDSPYLAPVPYRGKRNSSLYLPYVVQEIAELKGISEEEVIETTEKNAVRLFRAEE